MCVMCMMCGMCDVCDVLVAAPSSQGALQVGVPSGQGALGTQPNLDAAARRSRHPICPTCSSHSCANIPHVRTSHMFVPQLCEL